MLVSLNWTKVGLKAQNTEQETSGSYSLNWTKVGLKVDLTIRPEDAAIRLNWTKVGLKGDRSRYISPCHRV